MWGKFGRDGRIRSSDGGEDEGGAVERDVEEKKWAGLEGVCTGGEQELGEGRSAREKKIEG